MKHDGWNRFKVRFDISDHWSLCGREQLLLGKDNATEINPFVGNAHAIPGVPATMGPYNPDATTIGNIKRGGSAR